MSRQRSPLAGVLPWSLVLALLVLDRAPAMAEDDGPEFSAAISLELQDDYIFQASHRAMEINDAYATIEGEFALAYESGSGLFAKLVFEPVKDPSGDRYFGDHGLYAEELYLAWRGEMAGLRLGKLDLGYGLANELSPALYGDDLVGDYEMTELIGAALDVPLHLLGGEQVVTAALFMADRTVLSRSLFTDRGRLRRRDGGVSNTDHPESFMLSLSGSVDATGYALGLRYLAAGRGDASDETGAVAALSQAVIAGPLELEGFAELAYFPDFDGAREDAVYATLGAEVGWGDLTVATVLGLRRIEGGATDRAFGLSLSYALREDISIAAGYRFLDVDREASHTVGLLLRYEFDRD